MRHLKQFKEKDRNGEKKGQQIGETELVKQKISFSHHYSPFVVNQNIQHYTNYTGFSIEGGTRRLIAAYFGIYSRLLCV